MDEIMERNNDFKNEIIALISDNFNNTNLETLLEEYHLYDISKVVIEFEPDEIKAFFKTVSTDFAAEIIEYLEKDEAEYIIKIIGEISSAKIIAEMDLDDAVDILKHLKKSGIRILKHIDSERRKELLKIMLYDEDEIGAYITDSYLTLNANITVKLAMKQVVNEAHDVDYISIIYVVSEDDTLLGFIKLKDLIVARAEEILNDIIKTRFPKVYPNDDKEYVASLMQETSESSIPVINEDGKMEGIITHDDLLDIISLAQEEDYTKFAALGDIEINLNASTLKKSVKSRLPWLLILLGFGMVTSIILSIFDAQLIDTDGSRLLASRLAVYLPLILGMAGNTGTQSLAVMIRYLTKNQEIDKERIKKHLLREFRTGFFQGLIIGVLIYLMINFTNYFIYQEISFQNQLYAIVTSGSIFIALLISTSLGAFIPLFMAKLKIDPAVASGPFITTIADIITLSIYYSISLMILLPLFQ
ncbi:MAG: magnesium transporter [Candidatus Izemoplasmatales bacterium]|nr:magnesium transporter [Candidatus Izemoplasmatales bacterium]